jgi:hypothetical protein
MASALNAIEYFARIAGNITHQQINLGDQDFKTHTTHPSLRGYGGANTETGPFYADSHGLFPALQAIDKAWKATITLSPSMR